MATSGSKSITVTSYDTLKFSWSESSQSIANNTTTIAWTLQLIAGSSGRIDSSAPKSWSVTVNGTKYSGTNYIGIANNATKTLASGTTTIAHNADGTKTFSYSFSQQFSITFSGVSIGTKSGSGTGTLGTIARKSSLSASNGTLGTAQTLTVTRQSTSFTHTITYKCGSASGTVCTKSSSTSVSFTPPLSLASQNTTGTSVSVTLTITTYNGSTSIGSNTKTITCSIPASVKPSCSVTVTDTTGYKSVYGKAIKGQSKFKIVVSPTTSYGSAIASYKVTANGATYTAATSTTDVLKYSGDLTITAKVTDKRGRSGSITVIEEVYDYTAPAISKLSVKRCNADGTENDQGGFVQVTFSAAVDSVSNLNSVQYMLYWKKSADTTYTAYDLAQEDYGLQFEVTDGTYIFEADTESSYDVKLTASDHFQTVSMITSASTAKTILDFGANGTSVGVGKVAEKENSFECGFDAEFFGDVCGKVIGLGALPLIATTDNFNDYTEPGSWCVPTNAQASAMYTNGLNIPSQYAGRLIVMNGTGWDDPSTEYKYRLQYYIPYLTIYPVSVRYIRKTTESSWIYSKWSTHSYPTKDIAFTPVSGVTVNRCTITRNNDIVTMYISAKYNSAVTAKTYTQLGTIASDYPAKSVATAGVSGNELITAWVRNDKTVWFRPAGAYTANTDIEFNLTWNVAASWS